ncbi:MAG: hypothetical protein A2Y97_13960 [Nitrospirae bacterium RBG_13_39_12]|nr:MAG: hypothetical protein A2Y97_13960 [Nitrospirae bacterium RBG_13_39_12]
MGNAKILKTLLLLIFFFVFSFPVYADNEELFVWTDENGQTHYSNTKPTEWNVDTTGQQWESAGTIEFPDLYGKKENVSRGLEPTTKPSNIEVHKRREINLIERHEQAIQNRIIEEKFQRDMEKIDNEKRLKDIERKQQDLEWTQRNLENKYR